MNFRLVFRQLGLLLVVLSLVLLAVWVFSLVRHQFAGRIVGALHSEGPAHWAFLISAFIGLLIGGFLWLWTRGGSPQFGRREALLLVGLSWLIGASVSALPFLFWAFFAGETARDHPFGSYVNCYFEAMSGLTTTGATVLSQVEVMPKSILLWRATTHWLGGLGIVVLFVAVLPTLGVGGKKLFRVEAPGPEPEGVRPHIRETARVLWLIYLGLTIAEILALKLIGGLGWYESVCHTFATLATGGFSTRDASVGAYGSATVDVIVMIFMIAAGVNFALYFMLLRRRISGVWRDVELRFYLFVILFSSLIVVTTLVAAGRPIALMTGPDQAVEADVANSIRYGVFGVLTCQTTTGFCTADFNQWPFLAKAVLITLMFVGASGGSTGGGIKVIRIWITIKVMISELERVFRPQVVRPVKVGRSAIEPELKLGTIAYVFGIILIFAVGTVLIMAIEQGFNPASEVDFTTASTASVATLCNIGPGLAKVGAVENYGWFCAGSKMVMVLLMALGRLEVFAIIVLISPRFWRGD